MKLNKALQLNEISGEYMIIDTRKSNLNLSKVFCLNEPAAWLWKKIGDQDFTAEKLAGWVCEEYDVTYDVALKDVKTLLMLWEKSDMVVK